MKILFYGTKNYDEEFFEKLLPSYPGITIKFTEANIHEETASLAKGYEAICAFVNADLSTPVIEELNAQGVKLILMRCAGYNLSLIHICQESPGEAYLQSPPVLPVLSFFPFSLRYGHLHAGSEDPDNGRSSSPLSWSGSVHRKFPPDSSKARGSSGFL